MLCFNRREAVQMRIRRLRPAVRQQFRPEEALARAHVGQAVQLQSARLRQVVHAPVVAAQAHEGARQEHAAQRVQLRLGQSGQRQRQRLVAFQLAFADAHPVVDRLPRPGTHRPRPLGQQQSAGLVAHQPLDQLVRVVHLPKCGRHAYPAVHRALAHRTSDPLTPPSTFNSGLLTAQTTNHQVT